MARRGKIYMHIVRDQVKKALTKAEIKKHTHRDAHKVFLLKKRLYLKLFREHPVTEEIRRGPKARKNISGTLPGIYGGNLFSFIGFDEGSDPTEKVATAIATHTWMKQTPEYVETKNTGKFLKIRVAYKMLFPMRDDLAEYAPMPWEPGSWLRRIEVGMSGLGNYLFRNKSWMGFGSSKFGEKSNSGTAIQVKGHYQPKGVKFMKRGYISEITRFLFKKGSI